MSFFVYVSHRRPVEAFEAAEQLMNNGHFPFVPQLNKLIQGRKDEAWEHYYKMWLFKCDCIFLTPSYREHELDWAMTNDVPVTSKIAEVNDLKLPPFAELGRRFGEKVATLLPTDESWRKVAPGTVIKEYDYMTSRGSALEVAAEALKVWDRQKNG